MAKPKTELELDALQKEYLETKSEVAWKKMYEIMVSYARSLTLKMTKGRKFLDGDHILGVAVDSATKIMSRYLTQEDFYIKDSFGGLLKWKVLETLYDAKQRKADGVLSLNQTMSRGNSDNTAELGDLSEKFHLQSFSPLESYEPELAIDTAEDFFKIVQKTLKDFDQAVPYRLRVLARAYLLLFLRKSHAKNWRESFEKTFALNFKESAAMATLIDEIFLRVKAD